MIVVIKSRLQPFKGSPECISAWSSPDFSPQTSKECWLLAETAREITTFAVYHTRLTAVVAVCMQLCSPFTFWVDSGRSNGRAYSALVLWDLARFMHDGVPAASLDSLFPPSSEKCAL